MAENTEALIEQVRRVREHFDEAESADDYRHIANELIGAIEDMCGLVDDDLPEPMTNLGLYLSDLAEEPEKCQFGVGSQTNHCSEWALEYSQFCRLHI